MKDRFKFRAVLKTDTHSIITEPYYILGNGYLVNIDDVQKLFEKKYPDDCFWEFLEEIEKQENCQEVSTDSEIIIFDSFDGLIQSTGLKDKNGKLIYEGDILKGKKNMICSPHSSKMVDKIGVVEIPEGMFVATVRDVKNNCTLFCQYDWNKTEVIGNIYENEELLDVGRS